MDDGRRDGSLVILSRGAAVCGMAVAAFVVHGADPFAAKELSLIYLFIYAALVFTGPGKFSIDYLLRNVYAKIRAPFL